MKKVELKQGVVYNKKVYYFNMLFNYFWGKLGFARRRIRKGKKSGFRYTRSASVNCQGSIYYKDK
jgi:hypothetical protein